MKTLILAALLLSMASAQAAFTPFQNPQPVSGTFWQTTQPVSGTFWTTAAASPSSCRISDGTSFIDPRQVTVQNASLAVTGTFWQATQPVSGTFWQATQPVSGPLTDTQLRASAVPVSGPLTDTQLRATAVPVSGTFFQATQPVSIAATVNTSTAQSGTWSVGLTAMSAASSTPTGVVSMGNSLGKTNVLKTGSLVTTATTADQVVLTYTVTSGKTLYLEYLDVNARLTTFAATATNFGDCSLESPAGTKLYTQMVASSGTPSAQQMTFGEPIPIASATVIRIVCTPSAVTSFTWRANFGGYEK